MKKSVLFWILAFVITAGSAVYQRMTGPSYPVSGSGSVAGTEVSYRFDRSHGEDSDHTVRLQLDSSRTSVVLEWKRYKTDDPWTLVPMRYENGSFSGELPQQPPAGKLQYRARIARAGQVLVLPDGEPVVIRFRGVVPLVILIFHVVTIFGAMFLSTRTGLEFFNPNPKLGRLVWWTIGFLVVGGMILGPVVQKYAFGAFWTGWPFGTDLTDNKTLIGLIAWIIAAVALYKAKKPRWWTLGASIILFIVFLIPHSLLGSELDYKELDKKGVSPGTSTRE